MTRPAKAICPRCPLEGPQQGALQPQGGGARAGGTLSKVVVTILWHAAGTKAKAAQDCAAEGPGACIRTERSSDVLVACLLHADGDDSCMSTVTLSSIQVGSEVRLQGRSSVRAMLRNVQASRISLSSSDFWISSPLGIGSQRAAEDRICPVLPATNSAYAAASAYNQQGLDGFLADLNGQRGTLEAREPWSMCLRWRFWDLNLLPDAEDVL